MTKKFIAIIDKAPSRVDYKKYFDFEFDHHHMSAVPVPKLLKKDVTLDIDLDLYDYVILVGSEAAKEYAKITSVTTMQGLLVKDKFIAITNPSILIFKPEGKAAFEQAVNKITDIVSGKVRPAIEGHYIGIQDPSHAKTFLQTVRDCDNPFITMDSETSALYPRDGHVLGISLTYKEYQGAYILADCLDDECISILQSILDTKTIIFHNMKFDIKFIEYHLGVRFNRHCLHDTILMHYVLDENGEHGLKALAIKYTDFGDYDSALQEFKVQYCKDHKIKQEEFSYDLIPFDIMYRYAAIDTAAAYTLFLKFWTTIQSNPKLLSVYNDLLVPGTLLLLDMEEVGIPIARDRMLAAEDYLALEIERAKQVIYSFKEVTNFEKDAGLIFNANSVNHLRKVLFDYAKLPVPTKKTETGAISTDAEVLEDLAKIHELPGALLRVRKLTKIRNTYVTKILAELDKDERIRTNFNLIFTTSGRLSSSGKFNAQQIVRDDPIIKGCIVAPEGYSIVSQDLATGEMYYAAVLSGDKNLQQVFLSGGDFHSSIAHSVFNLQCAVEDVKRLFPGKRQAAKAINIMVAYKSL